MALPAILSLAPALIQGVQSIRQSNMAKKLQRNNYIPPSMARAVSSAESRAAKSTAPGFERAVGQMRQSTSNAVQKAKESGSSSGEIQRAVSASDRAEKEGIANLQVENQRYLDNASMNLERNLIQKAGMEEKNEDQYQAAQSALRGASQQNLFNAVTNAAEAGINMSGGSGTQASSGSNAFLGLDEAGIKDALAKRQAGSSTLTQEEIKYLRSIGMMGGTKNPVMSLNTGLIQ